MEKDKFINRLMEIYDKHTVEEFMRMDFEAAVRDINRKRTEYEGHLVRAYLKERSKLKSFMDQGIISKEEYQEQNKQLMTMYHIKEDRNEG